MTIDDFDAGEISDKLSIREESDDNRTLEAAHDDGHNDYFADGTCHNDISNSISHDDANPCPYHNDGHNDFFDDAPHFDCPDHQIIC